jgi:amino acid transporter
MEILRKFVNILVLLFLIFTMLVLLNIISTEYLDSTLTNFNPENFFKTVFGIAGGILLLLLIISNMSLLALKRSNSVLNNRVNELKANLYDKKTNQHRDSRPMDPNSTHPNPVFPPDNLQ